MVKKFRRYLFFLTQLTNVTDTQTDAQTPHDGIGRAYASHRAEKICMAYINIVEVVVCL